MAHERSGKRERSGHRLSPSRGEVHNGLMDLALKRFLPLATCHAALGARGGGRKASLSCFSERGANFWRRKAREARISGGKERCGEHLQPTYTHCITYPTRSDWPSSCEHRDTHFSCMNWKAAPFLIRPSRHPSEDIAMQTSFLHLDSSENSRLVPMSTSRLYPPPVR